MLNKTLTYQIRSRYNQVCEKIELAASSVGRGSESVSLVVVTKTHSLDTVLAALEAGIRDLGENYAEEAVGKINATSSIRDVTWHMIGHVQSRKADLVARHFDYVHSVDSLKIATRLERFASEYDRKLPILLECNVGGEESKFGFPAYDRTDWNAVKSEAEKIALLPHLEIRGLMTMPPLFDDSEITRPFFQRLRELRDFLAEQVPQAKWTELSMGTSTDFVVAVQEGATLVRVGTAILGHRPPKNE
jgi:pyridoxal phosphate enzyme (YggS family)